MENSRGRASILPFAKVKYVLIDLSGTLHVENDATPGAVEALERLREAGVTIRFVTNTTKESKRLLFERLSNLGFKIRPDEIFTSLIAARQVIENLGVRPMFLVEDEALEDFTGIDTSDPNAVVIGLSPTNFCYDGLNAAFRLLLKYRTLIAIHKGKYFKRQAGLCLGPGPFVSALEFATGTEATVVGKPNFRFFQAALTATSAEGCEVVMIGDDVQDDVLGAIDAGYLGILVQTGKYQPGDELKCSKAGQPFAVVENFASAVQMILTQRGVP